jgi:hypothetical protein
MRVCKWGKRLLQSSKSRLELYVAPGKTANITVLSDPYVQEYHLSILLLQNN